MTVDDVLKYLQWLSLPIIPVSIYLLAQQHRHHQAEIEKLQSTITKLENMRETERKGRIKSQTRARENILRDADENGFRYKAIATIESPFADRRGTPRQPLLVDAAKGRIRFHKTVVQYDYFKELENFSHIWILFVFHTNTNTDSGAVSAKIRPPRLGTKVGCLSTRSPHRPNNIGLSVCKVVQVCKDFIEVSGLDMVNGTPVIDGKLSLTALSSHLLISL
jgi:tRNA (adenine37-N6)-methyltransferase